MQSRGHWVGSAPRTAFIEYLLHLAVRTLVPVSGKSGGCGGRGLTEQRVIVQCDE